MTTLFLTLLALGMAPQGGSARPTASASEALTFTLTPVRAGRQLARVSLPLPGGQLREGQTFRASVGRRGVDAGTRVLTWYPAPEGKPRFARRALVTFPWTFRNIQPVRFTLTPRAAEKPQKAQIPVRISVEGETLVIALPGGKI